MSTASWAFGNTSSHELIPNFIAYGLILAMIFARAWWRLHTRTVIDVTPDELAIATVRPSGRGTRRSWPRSNVGEVKRNASDGKLLVRITGRDLLEWPISPIAEVTEWVAQAVNRSLSDEFAPPAPGDAFPPIVTKGYRPFMIALAIGLFVAPFLPLIIVSLKTGDWMPLIAILSIGGIGGLIIWAGITMGTQDKEFYF
jgi:hypothetical protein